GPRTPQRDAGRKVVVPFLRRAGATAVAIVVATHGDADHLGGIPAILAAFPPALVLEPGEPLGRSLYLEFLGAVEAAGSAWRPALALISVGAHNNYGHPAPEVVARLAAHDVRVLRTDRDGTITLDFGPHGAPHIDVGHHD